MRQKFTRPCLQAETAGSQVVVITAGVRQNVGESRRDLLARNVGVFRAIVPPLARASPGAVFLVVSNPVDVMTYVTWRLSGLPASQVIGSGTFLDTSRLRVLVAQRFGLSAMSVHATIIGEHGDASVPVWTGATAGGIPLEALGALTGEASSAGSATESGSAPLPYQQLHEQVKAAAASVIKLKGYTNWAIGAAVENIARCVLHDEHRAMPVSVNVRGHYGVTEDTYLSLPSIVGAAGRVRVLPPPLSPTEDAALRASAAAIGELHRVVDQLLAESQ